MNLWIADFERSFREMETVMADADDKARRMAEAYQRRMDLQADLPDIPVVAAPGPNRAQRRATARQKALTNRAVDRTRKKRRR